MADAPKKKILDILNEHGTGKGKDKSGVDNDKEDDLRALSKMTDDSGDGPVPKELKPYTEKKEAHMNAFERGYYRTLKIAANKTVVPGKAKFVDYDGSDKKTKKKPAGKKPKGKFDDLEYVDPFTTKKAENNSFWQRQNNVGPDARRFLMQSKWTPDHAGQAAAMNRPIIRTDMPNHVGYQTAGGGTSRATALPKNVDPIEEGYEKQTKKGPGNTTTYRKPGKSMGTSVK